MIYPIELLLSSKSHKKKYEKNKTRIVVIQNDLLNFK
jgi:hypothetical protein